MKYIVYILVLALTWAHIGPHFQALQKFQDLKTTVPACTLVTNWDWYSLGLTMGVTDCIKIIN